MPFGIWSLLRAAGLGLLLLLISISDLRTRRIPDRYQLAGVLWWLVTLPLVLLEQGELSWRSFGLALGRGVLGGLAIALPLLLLSLFLERVLGKETMGGGDLKLFFVTGLYLGPALNLMNLLLACLLGLAAGLLFRRRTIPFGPAISLAALSTLLWGERVLAAYLALVGL